MQERRTLLKSVGTVAMLGLAGCPAGTSPENESDGDGDDTPGGGQSGVAAAKLAVASELNVYRARLFDAVALGRAGASGAGAGVAADVFARFEGATGEYGAHETLEDTGTQVSEGFETGLEELQDALETGDIAGAADAASTGGDHVRTAQVELVGESNVYALDALVVGARAATAGTLARAGKLGAAGVVAGSTLTAFEEAAVHDELEATDTEAYDSLESGLEGVRAAAGSVSKARESADRATDAAVDAAYAMAPEPLAGAGHVALYQSRGWDAATAARLAGPGTDFVHAAALNVYRARAYDAHWVAMSGEADAAASMAEDIFAHFEGARAHEALESTDEDAYEGFEDGLRDLSTAIESGDSDGIDAAVSAVDDSLLSGIDPLAGANAPVIQCGFFRARFADARELSRQGKNGAAKAIAEDLFRRFEANELDFHETLEATSEDLYHRFEENHLASLVTAYENDDESAVETHHRGVMDALLAFEWGYDAAVASGGESGYFAARGFDAAGVAALGDAGRAAEIAESAFQHFEQGAAGYHEALEEADHETYEAFESALGAIRSASESGSPVYPEAKAFNAKAVDSAYAIAAAGGSDGVAAPLVSDLFADFEKARVHELLESADADAYQGFEAALSDYQSALTSGETGAGSAFADAARTAQFAVAGAPDAAPKVGGERDETEADDTDPSLQGGPNVVDGVPDDADHVVDLKAVSFAPERLTVSPGETVAWKHVGGEAHTVTASESELPSGAEYWASGGFDSEQAAREGWENGNGAVQSEQSFVHTFETTGDHHYVCIPHEAAGMDGTVVVE